MVETQLLIQNQNVAARGGRSFERKDPVTGKVASRAAAAAIEDAHAAVASAAAAFPGWSATGPGARRQKLLAAAAKLEEKAAQFAEIMTAETGCTPQWGHFNVGFAASLLREAASMTTQITGDVIPTEVPDNLALAVRQPVGVCLGIAPWNAPVILGVRAMAMPLACGNTVVFKASETCPATHALIGTAFVEAGLPAGAVNVVTNAPDDAAAIVDALVAHPAVKRVNFTGSTRVGKIIAKRAAEFLKPVLLELGGKAALVVLDDADIDDAAHAAAFGAFANQGQICMSTERVVVDRKVADEFVAKLASRASALSVGDPHAGKTVLGALVDQASVSRIGELLSDATAKGAKIIAGGEIDGALMQATVIDGVTPAMRLYAEESFGPIAVVLRAADEDDAVRIANDTEYGLSASVFTKNLARGLAVARRIDSGICHVNGPTVYDEGQMPFGGTKASGHGRFGGKAAIAEFTELRWITLQTGPRHYPF
jgi:acyl-CoA reductase-like NAD-dependent aldehyde dehydrogenase